MDYVSLNAASDNKKFPHPSQLKADQFSQNSFTINKNKLLRLSDENVNCFRNS
jgi:hypothetical protein